MSEDLQEHIINNGYDIKIKQNSLQNKLLDKIQSYLTFALATIPPALVFLPIFSDIYNYGAYYVTNESIIFYAVIYCILAAIIYWGLNVIFEKIRKDMIQGSLNFKDGHILISAPDSKFTDINSPIKSLVNIEINKRGNLEEKGSFESMWYGALISFNLDGKKFSFNLTSPPNDNHREEVANDIFNYLIYVQKV